jgi:hypothetical protein
MAQLQLDGMEQSLFRETSRAMRFVGIFWLVIAALAFVPLLLSAMVLTAAHAGGAGLKAALGLVDSGAMLALGGYTIRTAGRLLGVVQRTEGDVAPALMTAFADLRVMFFLWAGVFGVDLLTDVIELVQK